MKTITKSVYSAAVMAMAVGSSLTHGSRLVAADVQLEPVVKSMQSFVDSGQVSGVVTLVAQDGELKHLAAVGMADVDKKTPMTVDAPFAVASMTKPITATTFMTLVDEGKVSIDDPVEKYIPEFKDAKLQNGDAVEGLLVRHLLTHTSGLVGEQIFHQSIEAEAKALAARPFGFQPGAKWEYSPGLNVVARIIEVVSGQPYEQAVAERVLKPLGMTSTTFHPDAATLARVPVVYDRPGGSGPLKAGARPFATGDPNDPANPSGGLFSTAADLRRFYQMVLNGGELDGVRVLSAEKTKQMTTIQTPKSIVTGFTPGNGWGLGWCVIRDPQGVTAPLSPGTFGHGGYFGTQGCVDPAKKRVYVLLYQRVGLANSDGEDIRKEFYRTAVESLDAEK